MRMLLWRDPPQPAPGAPAARLPHDTTSCPTCRWRGHRLDLLSVELCQGHRIQAVCCAGQLGAPLILLPHRARSPTLGGKPYTRRVKATSGSGTSAAPYALLVPVVRGNEWTVQAVTGSYLNGASDADSWDTSMVAGAVQALTAAPALLQGYATCLHRLLASGLPRLLLSRMRCRRAMTLPRRACSGPA